jgi:hypothetical protein
LFLSPVHVTGFVVDSNGKPVAEAQIDHTGDMRSWHQTDAAGRFSFDTKAPSLVVRKAGFRSSFLHTQRDLDMRITLLKSARQFPICPATNAYANPTDEGFRFPKIPGLKISGRKQDIDYSAESYSVQTPEGRKWIWHGSGPNWNFGIPLDDDVWQSTQFEETVVMSEGLRVVDARGRLADGLRWRYLGRVGESAAYSDVNDATAKILDQMLDGACLAIRKPK